MSQRPWKTFPVFLLLCFAALAFGGVFTPGEWYESLQRAPWSPPNIAFPIVWSILYILIAVAGWLIFEYEKQHGPNYPLSTLWGVQLALNALWSWFFFGQHWVALGLIDLVALDILVSVLMIRAMKLNRTTIVCCLFPYLVWLLLATSLNGYIWLMN